jgi:hypothetical protein
VPKRRPGCIPPQYPVTMRRILPELLQAILPIRHQKSTGQSNQTILSTLSAPHSADMPPYCLARRKLTRRGRAPAGC